jgi:hypothetical protein
VCCQDRATWSISAKSCRHQPATKREKLTPRQADLGRRAASPENNRDVRVDSGNLFTDRKDLESVVAAVDHGRPVYLRDVADQILAR